MTNAKKAKKEDSEGSETFDEFTVGLRQAESAALMLKSPEDDAKIRACDALYKFAEKRDENKKVLLALNICETLFVLVRSEDKVVKRNAVMILGILSDNVAGRTMIRKIPKYFPSLTKLLQPDEFDTTREFSLLTICHLCLEYSGICEAIEKKAVTPIVECLKSTDPDIQKNAIDTLFLMMQDFEARPQLKTTGCLPILIELLSSDYPAIQNASLKLLGQATQDSIVRTALREMDVLNEFVNIIGNSTFNDLHVPALRVISNLLEDLECAKSLMSSGGLHSLLHFITDRAVYKESELKPPSSVQSVKDKGAKSKKPSPRRSAKKGKGDNDAKKEEEKPLSNTLPEAKIHACRAVMRTARNEETRKILHDADVERMLIALLSHEDEGVRAASAQTISVLAESTTCQNKVAELGGLELLIRMTRSDHRAPKSAGVTALAALTTRNPAICREVAGRNSGIEALVSCLHMPEPEMDTITVGGLTALTNLALEESTRPKILRSVSGRLLVPLLNSSSVNTQVKAALAVAAMLSETISIRQFCENDGVTALTRLVQSPSSEARRAACWAIYNLATNRTVAKTITRSHGIQLLQELNMSMSRRNAFSELALHRVLDANLEVKFALTGYLDFADKIIHHFYDPGQLLSAAEVLPLNDYLSQPLNDHRPIYLIHIQQSQPPPDGLVEDEEEPKDEQNSDEYADSMGLPIQDENLITWLEYAKNVILPLADPRLQAGELGRFVASCYGGAVDKEDLQSFRYELSMAEVKCELNSNVIPVGAIRIGAHLHRSLLFKFLADHIGLPVNLVRGAYGRSYNELMLRSDPEDDRSSMQTYVVDLMFAPGVLLSVNSSEAVEYISVA
ncbi:unnamed protein product [Calicophoron daubneyi]|uniref:EDR1/CTR1/ARMC3-like peptidase-like domain-containing protein n=1 Tax=Calicophoron daubneyi TaxID=300641 RepID=A0AAV2U0F0_CALDB